MTRTQPRMPGTWRAVVCLMAGLLVAVVDRAAARESVEPAYEGSDDAPPDVSRGKAGDAHVDSIQHDAQGRVKSLHYTDPDGVKHRVDNIQYDTPNRPS